MAFLSIVMIFAVQGTGIAVQLTTQWKLPELCGGKELTLHSGHLPQAAPEAVGQF